MRKIVISKRAFKRLEKLLYYLESEWSCKVKTDFIRKLNKALKQLQNYPESCQKTDFIDGLYMCVIKKQTSLFYRFDTTTIKIVTIFDNRMNENKLNEELP